jgi:hypothetical protein
VKHGGTGPRLGKSNLSVQLARFNLKSSRTIEPFASGSIEESSRYQVNPEVVWALATSIRDIQ